MIDNRFAGSLKRNLMNQTPRTPRPRRIIQEEKIAKLMHEFEEGSGPETHYVEAYSDLVESPEGALPPPDTIFETEVWVNARIRNSLPRDETKWPLVPIASLGAYTKRQADLFVTFLEDFYATELAQSSPYEGEPDWAPEISIQIEKDWAFQSGPSVDWSDILLAFGRLRNVIESLLKLPAAQDVAETISSDRGVITAFDVVNRLKALAQDYTTLDPQYGSESEVNALYVANTNPGLPATLWSLTREPWVTALEITRHYGGPHEGGWWYDHHEPIAVMLTRYDESAESVKDLFTKTFERACHRTRSEPFPGLRSSSFHTPCKASI